MRFAFFTGLLLLAASDAAQAEGTVDILSCRHSVVRDAYGLDKVPLNGPAVRAVIKKRCVGDSEYRDVTVQFYSAVHLTDSGICESAEYDERRKPTGIVLRALAEKSGCPMQDLLKYVQTSGLSDHEFLGILQFWNSQKGAPSFSADQIVNRLNFPTDRAAIELGDPSFADMERELVNKLRADLKSKSVTAQSVRTVPVWARDRLSLQDRSLPAYLIDAGYCYRVTVVARSNGFDVADVHCLSP